MKLNVVFSEHNASFVANFGEVHNISDGGYERGYAKGYEKGNEDGKVIGYADGQAAGYIAGQSAVVEELLGGAW